MPPGLAHALIALALQGILALPLAFLLRIDAVAATMTNGVLAATVGAALAIGFYVGRERRQAEEYFGSNVIPPWHWRPRSLRDAAWPGLVVGVMTVIVLVTR